MGCISIKTRGINDGVARATGNVRMRCLIFWNSAVDGVVAYLERQVGSLHNIKEVIFHVMEEFSNLFTEF